MRAQYLARVVIYDGFNETVCIPQSQRFAITNKRKIAFSYFMVRRKRLLLRQTYGCDLRKAVRAAWNVCSVDGVGVRVPRICSTVATAS